VPRGDQWRTSASRPSGSGLRLCEPGDSGVVLIEAALVVVILVALIGGIVEVGSLSRSRIALERLSSSAARVIAAGTAASSDLDVLRAVGESVGTLPGADVRRVVVFRSDTGSGGLPQGCETVWPTGTEAAGVAGVCNVYGPAHVDAAVSLSMAIPPTGCAPPSGEAAWCPASRVRDLPGTERAGVLIEVTQHALAIGLFGSQSRVISVTAVAMLEPEVR